MKKAVVWLIAVLLAGAGALRAQEKDISGNWQGTLEAGKGLRTVLKVTRDDNRYKGVMYSIDQGGQPIPLSSLTLQGTAFHYEIKFLELTYDGTLSADGNSIAGSATQRGQTHTLNFTHVSPENTWAIPEPPKPMPADAKPKFDVVTVKPSDPNRPGKLFTIRGRHLVTINTSVSDLITFAYGLHAKQLANTPTWIDDKFDLDGVPDVEGQPSTAQMKMLIQDALVTRFGLTFHREQRELSVYALSVTKAGPKMSVTGDEPSTPGNFIFSGPGRLHVTNSTMQGFCDGMQAAVMDKPVVDHTGLKDRYDFNLNWTPDQGQFAQMGGYRPPAQDDPNAPPSLYTAIEEQLGLKLEATKSNADVFVIDKIQKPGEN